MSDDDGNVTSRISRRTGRRVDPIRSRKARLAAMRSASKRRAKARTAAVKRKRTLLRHKAQNMRNKRRGFNSFGVRKTKYKYLNR